MLKEINEQPAVMRRIIQEYEDENGDLKIDPEIVKDVAAADRIYIIAAGTSYHAGLVGKEYLEKWAGVPTEVHVALNLFITCHYYLKTIIHLYFSIR